MAAEPGSAPPRGSETPSRITRRGFVLGGVVVLSGGGVALGRWFNVGAGGWEKNALSAPDAHAQAITGQITLVDIRRPDEWARTGVPEGGVALDMRQPDFATALLAHVKGVKDTPIALICARGVRSRKMAVRMRQAGFTRIIDVPEGMLGSGAGPGWGETGLARSAPRVTELFRWHILWRS